MNRHLALTLALAIVLGLATKGVFARGGGHGGGHGGGGHHGGAHHNGGHQGHHDGHHANHHHQAHYANHNRPFTHGWYGNHPGAWGGWGWGSGNAWAPAAFGTTAAWLGLSAANSVGGGYQPVETVYTADQGDQDDQATASNDDSNDNGDEPSAEENQPQNFAPAAPAAELVKSGVTDPPQDARLLPLGVYSLAPKGQQEASAMVQLSVSKDGVLRGSYYDLLSNQAHPIQGAVDKKTQRVAWTVGSGGKVLFETSLANLTQETGPLSVHYENGQSRQWTVARYKGDENEATDKEETPAEPKV